MSTQTCLTCPRLARYRGQCNRCLTRTRRRVAAGETTEAAEIAAGRLLPSAAEAARNALREREHRRIRGNA